MNTEIELKYLVKNENTVELITHLLQAKCLAFEHNSQALSNCYFDTPEQLLRSFDMGLRVRTKNNQHEQTIKTAGIVVGGLHQRPEYNINVESTFPDLALFPQEIWTLGQDVSVLQAQLVPLFTTNFTRHTWLVTVGNDTVIELAFDQGDISTAGRTEDICEIELELVSGERIELLNLAQLLFGVLSLRPGIKSKAARGYALWLDLPVNHKLTTKETIPLATHFSIEQSFVAGLNFGLVQLQELIHGYVNKPSLQLLVKAGESIALLRHGFWLFADYLPESAKAIRDELTYYLQLFKWVDSATYIKELTNKTGNYRKKIELSQQLFTQLKLEKNSFPSKDDVLELIYSERFNQLQLSLLSLLLTMGASNKQSHHTEDLQPNSELFEFSKQALSTSLRTVFRGLNDEDNLSSEQYVTQKKWVVRCLLSGSWFGSLYEDETRSDYRRSWLDIKQGLSELETLWLLHNQLEKLPETPEKLLRWQKGKVDNLLVALDASRLNAFNVTPYWEAY